MTDGPDYGSAYRELRLRLTDLLRSAEPAALDTIAPATPEWRVRDVAAHLAGICDDAVHGNMGDVASTGGSLLVGVNDPTLVNNWTDLQVAKRADWPIEQVLDNWAEHAVQLEPTMNHLHPAIGQMVADAVTHEHDIRGGLGTPGARDSTALEIAFNWVLHPLSRQVEKDALGTLLIEHEHGEVALGAGDPVTRLRTTRFEIARVVTGRRSMAQIQAMDWHGPLDPGVLLLAPDFYPPRATALVE
jgi:hypothetical protein